MIDVPDLELKNELIERLNNMSDEQIALVIVLLNASDEELKKYGII